MVASAANKLREMCCAAFEIIDGTVLVGQPGYPNPSKPAKTCLNAPAETAFP